MTGATFEEVTAEVFALGAQARDAVNDATGLTFQDYGWRPDAVPEPPCVYWWLANSPTTVMDAQPRVRLTWDYRLRFALGTSEQDKRMGKAEQVVGAALGVLLPAMFIPGAQLLDGKAQWGQVGQAQMVGDEWPGVMVLAVEFTVQAMVDYKLRP